MSSRSCSYLIISIFQLSGYLTIIVTGIYCAFLFGNDCCLYFMNHWLSYALMLRVTVYDILYYTLSIFTYRLTLISNCSLVFVLNNMWPFMIRCLLWTSEYRLLSDNTQQLPMIQAIHYRLYFGGQNIWVSGFFCNMYRILCICNSFGLKNNLSHIDKISHKLFVTKIYCGWIDTNILKEQHRWKVLISLRRDVARGHKRSTIKIFVAVIAIEKLTSKQLCISVDCDTFNYPLGN